MSTSLKSLSLVSEVITANIWVNMRLELNTGSLEARGNCFCCHRMRGAVPPLLWPSKCSV
jgi:hypothetical protein